VRFMRAGGAANNWRVSRTFDALISRWSTGRGSASSPLRADSPPVRHSHGRARIGSGGRGEAKSQFAPAACRMRTRLRVPGENGLQLLCLSGDFTGDMSTGYSDG
jgi:hypothetical protein